MSDNTEAQNILSTLYKNAEHLELAIKNQVENPNFPTNQSLQLVDREASTATTSTHLWVTPSRADRRHLRGHFPRYELPDGTPGRRVCTLCTNNRRNILCTMFH